jgi:hypothetical protein
MSFSRVSTALITNVPADGSVTDIKVASNAAIAFSKLAPLASATLLIGNGSNVATSTALSGDATVTNGGVLTIGAGAVDNAKVSSSAAIAFSKLAPLTTGQILAGNAGVPTATTISGDATINATGTLTIATDAITNGKILNDAVTTTKILNSNVTAAKVLQSEVAVLGTAQQYTRTHNFTATTLTASTSSVTWDLEVNQILILTLSANVSTWTIQNPKSGGVYILIVKQDTTGSRTLAFPTGNFKFPGGAAGAPTLTVTPGKSDILTFVYHGSHLHGVAVQDYAA